MAKGRLALRLNGYPQTPIILTNGPPALTVHGMSHIFTGFNSPRIASTLTPGDRPVSIRFDSQQWALILGGSSGFGLATAKNSDRHSRSILKQFKEQCIKATNNKPMCKCAKKAFKVQVPPSQVRIGHPTTDASTLILQVPEEYIQILAVDVAQCEIRFPVH